MAKTTITPVAAPGGLATTGQAWTWLERDSSGNQFVSTGKELLLAWNNSSTAATVTVTSAVDDLNRLGDVTADSLGEQVYKCYGPFPIFGWKQTDGYVYCSGSSSDINFGVITLP